MREGYATAYRRDVLKGIGAGSAALLGASEANTVQAVDTTTEAGGEPVIYQYFHTEWSEIEQNVDVLDDAGVTAVWLPQPAIGKLGWDDLAFQGSDGFYGDETSPYGGRDPHPPAGYQPVDLRDFDGTLGTEAELESMIETLHDHDIDVVLDTVLNHMANPYAPEDPWGGELEWPQFDIEPHFTSVPYHEYEGEIRDPQYDEPLLALPNLDTLNDEVQSIHIDYLTKIAELGADGIRFDAAAHVWPEYFENVINPLCDDLGLWRVGEIWDEGDVGHLQEFVDTGMDAFDFPLYSTLKGAIEGGDLSGLHADSNAGLVHADPGAAVTFSQNHDTVGPNVQPNEEEGHSVDLADAFILSYPGTPHLYRSGVRQNGPDPLFDEEMRDLIWVKTHLASGDLIDRHAGQQTYIYEREGNLLAGISVSDTDETHTVQTSWPGETLIEYTGHGADVQTDASGQAEISVPANGWVMYAPEDIEGEPPGSDGVSVTVLSATNNPEEGDDVDFKIEVENEGNESVTQEITLAIDGDEVDSTRLSLAPEEGKQDVLQYTNAVGGDRTATVSSDDDVATKTVWIGGQLTLQIEAPTADGESVYFTGSTSELTEWGTGIEGTNVGGDTWEVTIDGSSSFEWKTRRGPTDDEYIWEAGGEGENHDENDLSPVHMGWMDEFDGSEEDGSDHDSSDDDGSDDGSSDDGGSDDSGSDDGSSDDDDGPDGGGSDDDGSDNGGSDDSGSDDGGSDNDGSDDGGSDDSGSDDGGSDGGSDDRESDDGSSDDGGSDNDGPDDGSSDDRESDDGGSDDGESDDSDVRDDGSATDNDTDSTDSAATDTGSADDQNDDDSENGTSPRGDDTSTETDGSNIADDDQPGFGIGATVSAIGGALLAGKRVLEDNSDRTE